MCVAVATATSGAIFGTSEYISYGLAYWSVYSSLPSPLLKPQKPHDHTSICGYYISDNDVI